MLGVDEICNFINEEIDDLISVYRMSLGIHNEVMKNRVSTKLDYLPHVFMKVGLITAIQEELFQEKIKEKKKKAEDEKLWKMESKL